MKIFSCYTTDNFYSNKIDGEIVAIYKDGIGVKVSNGEIVITSLQLEGKKKMSALEFLNGFQNKEVLIGQILG